MISLLLSDVRDGGKNLPGYASTSFSHVSTEPYGNDSYHLAAISLKEKGKRCSFIVTPQKYPRIFIIKFVIYSGYN